MDLQLGLTRAPDFPTDEKSLAARFDAKPWVFSTCVISATANSGAAHLSRRIITTNTKFRLHDRRISRRLSRQHPALLRTFQSADQSADRPVESHVSARSRAGPFHRMARGSRALVGLLAEGEQNGIMDEPRFEVYMRHWYPPDPNIAEIPGEWRAEKTWPPANTHTQTYFSSRIILWAMRRRPRRPSAADKLQYVPSIGNEAGFWWGDLTADQRPIDAYSLVYDSAPLVQDTALLGWPKYCCRFPRARRWPIGSCASLTWRRMAR